MLQKNEDGAVAAVNAGWFFADRRDGAERVQWPSVKNKEGQAETRAVPVRPAPRPERRVF